VEVLKAWLHSHCTNPSTITSTPSLPTTPLNLTYWGILLKKAVAKGTIAQEKVDILLKQLHEGFPLGVRDDILPPSAVRQSPNLTSARPELPSHDPVVSLKILQSLQHEVEEGRTAGPFSSPPLSNLQISPIGAVPKSHSTKLRLIHHLSWPRISHNDISVNDRLHEEKCEYVKFSDVIKRIGELGTAYLLSKFDVKEAFRLLRVIPRDQHLLGIYYLNYYFYERCYPFGVHPGPAMFESFATAIEAILRLYVKEIFHYADDFLSIASPEDAEREYIIIKKIFAILGVPLSVEKLSPPSPTIEFLGTMIDCQRQIIYIPGDKLQRYREAILSAAISPSITVGQLQSLIGILRYAARCIQHGSYFIHYLQADLTMALRSCDVNYNQRHKVKLTQPAIEELTWWKRYIVEWNGRGIIPPSLSSFPLSSRRCMFTDACRTGMGAWLRRPHHPSYETPQYLLHAWTATELKDAHRKTTLSMPFLELLSVVIAVYTWRNELAGSPVDLQSDCKPVVDAINKGYSSIPLTHQLLLCLFFITNKYNIFISCTHIAGEKNTEADVLSRIACNDIHQQTLSLSSDFYPLPSVAIFHSTNHLIQKETEALPSLLYKSGSSSYDIPPLLTQPTEPMR